LELFIVESISVVGSLLAGIHALILLKPASDPAVNQREKKLSETIGL